MELRRCIEIFVMRESVVLLLDSFGVLEFWGFFGGCGSGKQRIGGTTRLIWGWILVYFVWGYVCVMGFRDMVCVVKCKGCWLLLLLLLFHNLVVKQQQQQFYGIAITWLALEGSKPKIGVDY